MAKRGRKKKSKVNSLSAADKSHLKRIMAKVRQIKANKAATAPPAGKVNAALVQSLQQQYDALNANFNRFVTASPNFNNPTTNQTFKALAQQVADALGRLQRAQLGFPP